MESEDSSFCTEVYVGSVCSDGSPKPLQITEDSPTAAPCVERARSCEKVTKDKSPHIDKRSPRKRPRTHSQETAEVLQSSELSPAHKAKRMALM